MKEERSSAFFEKQRDKHIVYNSELINKNIGEDPIFPIGLDKEGSLENVKLLCRACNSKYVHTAFHDWEFQDYLEKILQADGEFRNVRPGSKIGADFMAERRRGTTWEQLAFDVKYTTSFTMARIYTVVELFQHVRRQHPNTGCVLVFPGKVTEKAMYVLKQNGIEVWDRDYLAEQFGREMEKFFHPVFSELLKKDGCHQEKVEKAFLKSLKACAPGRENWSEYQRLMGEMLIYLFCPPLLAPLLEKTDKSGANRRDFIFPNYCDKGFWAFLRSRYWADYIVVDTKNYREKITKKEILQMSNYLKVHGPGLFGIIVTRNGADEHALYTLQEAWKIEQKMILVLQDHDMEQMLLEKLAGGEPETVIRQKIEDFRLSV